MKIIAAAIGVAMVAAVQACHVHYADGNRICGPGNPEGKPAGCYDDGGVLEAYWPCRVAIDPKMGDTDIFVDGNPIPVYVY